MRITDLLDRRSIDLNGTPSAGQMVISGNASQRLSLMRSTTEKKSPRPVSAKASHPHGKCDAVIKPSLAAMVVKDGVD